MISFNRLGSIGNLGNQLFQIASMHGLSEHMGTLLTLPDWPYYSHFKGLSYTTGATALPECKEAEFTYNPAQFTDNSDISGYLQSEKYFASTPISLRDPLPQINAVAISIRRGDLINNTVYDTPPIEYYIKAYETHFYGMPIVLFSDDIEYCKWHFEAYGPLVTYCELEPIEQLRTGAACICHIISNSTFSWWMAYLSRSQKVIRPPFNFAPGYRVDHPEHDYWPDGWEIFDWRQQDKWNLKDVTFTIPVKIDTPFRLRNLQMSVDFLLKFFDTNIHVMESGRRECEEFGAYGKYTYRQQTWFHRTKMLNDMAREATTPYVCNFDCDTVFTPLSILQAVRALRAGADIAYPFDGRVVRIPYHHPDNVRLLSKYIASTNYADVGCLTFSPMPVKQSSVGHLVLVNRESFFRRGENEKFISYGPEDAERWCRWNKLELRIHRVPCRTFHLDHPVMIDSCNKAPFYHQNHAIKDWQDTLSKQELINEIKTWTWAL